jgi:hypothetical protein
VEPSQLFSALVDVAEKLGIAVRVEPFGLEMLRGRSGFCRIGGRSTIVVDERAPLVDRIAVVAGLLAKRSLDDVEMPEVVRAEIRRRRRGVDKRERRPLRPLASAKKR